MNKTCTKCFTEKPVGVFCKKSSAKDKLDPWCPDCKKKSMKKWLENGGRLIKAISQEKWSHSDHGRKIKNLWRKQNRWKNRLKINARNRVWNLILSGKLSKKPCSKCPDKMGEAHHTDYTRPLEIIWLCRKCHNKEHATK